MVVPAMTEVSASVLQRRAGLQLQFLHHQLERDRRLGIIRLVGVGFRIVDEFLDRFDRQVVVDDEDEREGHNHPDRRKVAPRRIHRALFGGLADRHGAAGRGQQGVAVGRRVLDIGASQFAAGARLVVDNDRLAEAFAHLLADEARQDVDAAASGVGYHHVDRPIGLACRRILRGGAVRHRSGEGDRQRGGERGECPFLEARCSGFQHFIPVFACDFIFLAQSARANVLAWSRSGEQIMPAKDWLSPAVRAAAIDRKLKAGEALFRLGDKASGLFEIVSGRVRLARVDRAGREVVLHVAQAGETIAEASLFSPHYHCDAIASTDSVVRLFPKPAVLAAFENEPKAAQAFAAALARQVVTLRTRIEQRNIRSARERLRHYLSVHADTEGHSVALPGTLKDLAAELGLSHEALYRTLAALERAGEIMRAKGKILLTPKKRRV
jgi:CRP-like cAMP-binding protein